MNECQLEGEFKQCCCNCRYHAAVHHHCSRDTELRNEKGGCVCGIQKGWACLGFISQPAPPNEVWRIHDNWPEHSVGCEMYNPISTVSSGRTE